MYTKRRWRIWKLYTIQQHQIISIFIHTVPELFSDTLRQLPHMQRNTSKPQPHTKHFQNLVGGNMQIHILHKNTIHTTQQKQNDHESHHLPEVLRQQTAHRGWYERLFCHLSTSLVSPLWSLWSLHLHEDPRGLFSLNVEQTPQLCAHAEECRLLETCSTHMLPATIGLSQKKPNSS